MFLRNIDERLSGNFGKENFKLSMMDTLRRVLYAGGLIFLFWMSVTYELSTLFHVLATLATMYDVLYLHRQVLESSFSRKKSGLLTKCRFILVFIFGSFMVLFNEFIYYQYLQDALSVSRVILISQVGDGFQYLGKYVGRHYIGWISPRKTWEGYIMGYVGLLMVFLRSYSLGTITVIYITGIGSSLLSSLIKRILYVKDYSDLLGPHGGWIDRIDSIVGPILLEYFKLVRRKG